MVVHQDFEAGVLLTNGLGLNGCSGGLTTAWHFHLIGCDVAIIPPVPDGGGGSIPLAPGEIANLYQPVPQQYVNPNNTTPPYYVPADNLDILKTPKNHVVIRIKLNGNEVEKEYLVNDKTKERIIKILNIIVTNKERFKVSINNLKKKIHNIIVSVKNLKNK